MTTLEKTKVIISGINGTMGNLLREKISQTPNMEVVAGFGRLGAEYFNPMGAKADVLIDFSNGNKLEEILKYCVLMRIPAVIATTGLNAEHKRLIDEASKFIPILQDYNMSVGMALLIKQIKCFTKNIVALGIHKQCQIDIEDIHHDKKADAPSGTTFKIIDAINQCLPLEWQLIPVYGLGPDKGKRKNNEVVILSRRFGKIVGTHKINVSIAGSEILKFEHEAEEKDIFANGAVVAANFLIGKSNGVYTIADMLDQ